MNKENITGMSPAEELEAFRAGAGLVAEQSTISGAPEAIAKEIEGAENDIISKELEMSFEDFDKITMQEIGRIYDQTIADCKTTLADEGKRELWEKAEARIKEADRIKEDAIRAIKGIISGE